MCLQSQGQRRPVSRPLNGLCPRLDPRKVDTTRTSFSRPRVRSETRVWTERPLKLHGERLRRK